MCDRDSSPNKRVSAWGVWLQLLQCVAVVFPKRKPLVEFFLKASEQAGCGVHLENLSVETWDIWVETQGFLNKEKSFFLSFVFKQKP